MEDLERFLWMNNNLLMCLQRIQYAKTDSEVISKMKGTYGDKEKKKKDKKKAQEPPSNVAKKPAAVSDALLSCLHFASYKWVQTERRTRHQLSST